MSALRWLRNFVELRPVFTLHAVQVVWWIYVCEKLYSTHWGLMRTSFARGPAPSWYNWVELGFTPLRVLVGLATVRLLIEVLLALLIPSRHAPRPAQSPWRELLAFVDLRPFFTPWWLQLFWCLYLLTFLWSVYPVVAFAPPWVYAASPANWFQFFHALLNRLIWLAGVRLLVEAALIVQAPAPRAPEQP